MGPARGAGLQRAKGRTDLPVVLGALTGGLLSSSCCIIQLVLNYLSVGCAGLSVFKPYRPLLRAATAGLLALLLARHGVSRRTLGTAVASLLLTFSEDALAAVNRHGSVRLMLQRAGLLRGAGGGAEPGAGAPPPAVAPPAVRWRVEVDGMRCQACAARVRGSVAALPGVRNATVELAEGHVEVWADAGGGLDGGALATAIGALDDAYAVRVSGRDCFHEDGRPTACAAGDGGGGGGGAQAAQQREEGPQQTQEGACERDGDAAGSGGGGEVPPRERPLGNDEL